MHAAVVPRASGIDVAALYAGHWRTMVRLAVLLVDDLPTAEDVVQESFVSLYRRRDAVRARSAGPRRRTGARGRTCPIACRMQ